MHAHSGGDGPGVRRACGVLRRNVRVGATGGGAVPRPCRVAARRGAVAAPSPHEHSEIQ